MQLTVEKMAYPDAMKLVVDNHYLHRRCHCSVAVGLFDCWECVGVIIFGKPASYTLCEGLFGKEESKNVGEFSRLWVRDDQPRNTESWFIARALKFCPYDALVSFADSEQGHTGYIYQATNWLYTGVSPKQRYYRVKSVGSDNPVQYRRRARMPKEKIIKLYGTDAVEEYFSSAKYRYVLILNRKKELLKKLKYKVLPYPKG